MPRNRATPSAPAEEAPKRFRVEKYRQHSRNWAVYDGDTLLAVTVYKRGAETVRDRLEAQERMIDEFKAVLEHSSSLPETSTMAKPLPHTAGDSQAFQVMEATDPGPNPSASRPSTLPPRFQDRVPSRPPQQLALIPREEWSTYRMTRPQTDWPGTTGQNR